MTQVQDSAKAMSTSPLARARSPMIAGLAVVGIFFGGFGAWAAISPLDSAALAPGRVAVDSRRQTVQHLEGGIISQILVQEGSTVEQGDVLIRLDRTRAEANVGLLTGQYLSAIGEKARLLAERDGLEEIRFFGPLAESQLSDEARALVEGQINVFESRREYIKGQKEIIEQRRLQFEQEIRALQSQERAASQQLALINEEIRDVQELVDKGLERRPRLLSLQRAAAEIDGDRGEFAGRIAQSRQQIEELRSQLIDMENQRLSEVVALLKDTEDQIFDLQQRLSAAQDILTRTDIVAPRSGIVVNMQYHTPEGVISPGSPVLDIVPNNDRLLIEAQVNPIDIEVIQIGMPAQVRLTPYSQRTVPVLDATLVHISADALTDAATNQPYYMARVEVDPSGLEKLQELEDVRLIPGMPAEVMLLTGQRTALEYMIAPIRNSLNRAALEQ